MNLEGDPGEKAKFDERLQLLVVRRKWARLAAANDADTQRRDDRIPAGLLIRHAHVIVVAQIETPLGDPTQFYRLTLGRLARHPLHFVKDEQGLSNAEPLGVAEQGPDGQDIGRVTDVDRDR